MTDKKVAYVCFWTRGEYSSREETPFLIVKTEERAQEIVRSYSRRLAEYLATAEITETNFATVRVDFLFHSPGGTPLDLFVEIENGIITPCYGDEVAFYYADCEIEE